MTGSKSLDAGCLDDLKGVGYEIVMRDGVERNSFRLAVCSALSTLAH